MSTIVRASVRSVLIGLILGHIVGFGISSAAAQYRPDIPGRRIELESEMLGERRIVHVILPDNYEAAPAAAYDVIYLMDAEDDARQFFQTERFLESNGLIPQNLIVAISTWFGDFDRDRSLTPTRIPGSPTSGGASAFLAFVRDELIPYVDSTYRTSGLNTYYGESYGGLFGMYALLSEPSLFTSYVLTDPSLSWDAGYLTRLARERLAGLDVNGTTLWISGRDGYYHDEMGLTEIEGILRSQAPSGLRWKSVAYPNETHFSLLYKSAYDGLKYTYSGYVGGGIEYVPATGVVISGLPFPLLIDNRLPPDLPVRYAVDGAKPDRTSPELETVNLVTSDLGRITMSSFGFRKRHDLSVDIEYERGEFVSPRSTLPDLTPGGLSYAYYEGAWERLPEFMPLTPVSAGTMDGEFGLDSLARDTNFAVRLDGFFEAEEDGYYIFLLSSDDGSRLSINDRTIIDHDGLHARWETKSYIVPLRKGMHRMNVEYFQREGGQALNVRYIPPAGKVPVVIPSERLYHSTAQE